MCNAAVSRDHSSMLNNKIREWICGVIASSDPRLGGEDCLLSLIVNACLSRLWYTLSDDCSDFPPSLLYTCLLPSSFQTRFRCYCVLILEKNKSFDRSNVVTVEWVWASDVSVSISLHNLLSVVGMQLLGQHASDGNLTRYRAGGRHH